MIKDTDVKLLIEDLYHSLDYFKGQYNNPRKAEDKKYFEGLMDGIDKSIKLITAYNNRYLKGFSSAVYGKKVAKEAKKNPRKAGKKMEQAFRNML